MVGVVRHTLPVVDSHPGEDGRNLAGVVGVDRNRLVGDMGHSLAVAKEPRTDLGVVRHIVLEVALHMLLGTEH